MNECKNRHRCGVMWTDGCDKSRICFEAVEDTTQFKIVRNHIEIEVDNRKFEISIEKSHSGKETILINKQGYEGESSQIIVGAKCSNEIEIM